MFIYCKREAKGSHRIKVGRGGESEVMDVVEGKETWHCYCEVWRNERNCGDQKHASYVQEEASALTFKGLHLWWCPTTIFASRTRITKSMIFILMFRMKVYVSLSSMLTVRRWWWWSQYIEGRGGRLQQ